MKIKVVFLFSGTGVFRYGVAEVFRHVLNALDKQRYQSFLVITGTLEAPIEGLSEEVEVVELHKHSLRKACFPLMRTIRRIRPDLVISAMEHPNALAVLVRLISRHHFKLVLTSHGVFTPRLKFMWNKRSGRVMQRAVRWAYPLADHVVCVSQAVRSDLSIYVPRLKESSVIHNPVLRSEELLDVGFRGKKKGLIVTSSRLTAFKKVDEAIRALTYLGNSFHLVVLGDGPELGKLEALATELDVSSRVTFAGYVGDPFTWYRQAEIFVLPSMWEGFGNVLIESMACGCQVVANVDAWAPPEVLGYGQYGFLYKGGDARALAESIREASEHPKSLESLIEYAHQFTDKRAACEYENLFDTLLVRRPALPPRDH